MSYLQPIAGFPHYSRLPVQALMASPALTLVELRVLAVICASVTDSGLTNLGQDDIAVVLGYRVNRRAGYEVVSRAISSLRKKGWLKLIKKGSKGTTSVNQVTIPSADYSVDLSEDTSSALDVERALKAKRSDGTPLFEIDSNEERLSLIESASKSKSKSKSKLPPSSTSSVSAASPSSSDYPNFSDDFDDLSGGGWDWVSREDALFAIQDYETTGVKLYPVEALLQHNLKYPTEFF